MVLGFGAAQARPIKSNGMEKYISVVETRDCWSKMNRTLL